MAAIASSTAVGLAARCSAPCCSRSAQLITLLVVDLAADLHDRDQRGQVVEVVEDLGDLDVVLGEDDLGLGVGQDEGDVLVGGGRVDRGGRAARRT